MPDPVFQLRPGGRVKHPCGIPQVLDDMDQIDNDRKIKAVLFCQAFEDADLTLIAINQGKGYGGRSSDLRNPKSGFFND